MNNLLQKLMLGGSAFAICAAASPVFAQDAAAGSDLGIEQVIVTGTNIRGAAPVGVNIITVDTHDIQGIGAQETSQIFADVPSINRFGGPGQTGDTHNGNGTFFSPSIHQLGESASDNTLVLVDGHRAP